MAVSWKLGKSLCIPLLPASPGPRPPAHGAKGMLPRPMPGAGANAPPLAKPLPRAKGAPRPTGPELPASLTGAAGTKPLRPNDVLVPKAVAGDVVVAGLAEGPAGRPQVPLPGPPLPKDEKDGPLPYAPPPLSEESLPVSSLVEEGRPALASVGDGVEDEPGKGAAGDAEDGERAGGAAARISCMCRVRMKSGTLSLHSPPAMPALASDGFAEGASLPSDAPDLTRRWDQLLCWVELGGEGGRRRTFPGTSCSCSGCL